MELKESKTFENLQTAFQGEAKAHLKYQFYRSKLGKLSKDVEKHLDEIIHNEKEHGKIWFKQIHGGEIPENIENLKDAIKGELMEHNEMYPKFAEIAYEEGFTEIGDLFNSVAAIEGQHADEFCEILNNIENEYLFEDDDEWDWICLNCGHIHIGKKAPEECPVCKHPKKYFTRD